MPNLSGKVALITGGTTGIGAATAKLLHDQGATVVITGSKIETIELARKQIPGIEAILSDQSDIGATEDLIGHINFNYGKIDILCLNAGIMEGAPINCVDEEAFDRQFNVNTKGPYFTIKHAYTIMPPGSAIVLTSSSGASMGIAGTSVYSATKAALRSFCRTLASELAPYGIRINTISPGPVDTPLASKTGLSKEQIDHMLKTFKAMMPLARIGRPEEIAKAILFLATDATFTTGSEFVCDGGMLDT
ncbi:SDR family oxidoreductase [Methylobacterium sp. 092160098-2]|uniref:SDR family oxidoreductase n=1 Tax=Methylobacterium sp. 092160098-2 TaxID=3025129 RepID=UPI0023819A77|nr:SDR family oxidoreductase [Methylobacterium sp. 092160098-2]MDE4915221.1 SDR family oxidoreductase [Methylobacterium sp. 092160098-2]